jgi:hypothetical protein
MANVIEMKSKFTPLPEGSVACTIAEIQDKPDQDIPAQYIAANKQQAIKEGRDPEAVATKVDKVVFIYKDADGNEAAEWYTKSLGTRASLRKRVESLLGGPPPSPFDLDTLIGMPVTVITERVTNAKGYPAAKIVAVMRRKGVESAKAGIVAAAKAATYEGITDSDLGF